MSRLGENQRNDFEDGFDCLLSLDMPFDLSKLGYWLHTSEKYMVGFLGIAIWDSVSRELSPARS